MPVAVHTSSRTPRSPISVWTRVESMVEPHVEYTRVNPHNTRVQSHDTRVKYISNRPSVPPRYKRSPQDEEDKNLGKVLIKLDNIQ